MTNNTTRPRSFAIHLYVLNLGIFKICTSMLYSTDKRLPSIDLEIDFMVMARLVGDNRETDMVTWWDPLLSLPLGNNGRDQQWFQRCSRHFVSLSFPPSSWRTIERGFTGPLHTKATTTAFIRYSREAQYHGFNNKNNKTINISHIHKEDIKYQMCLTNLKPVDEFNLACLTLVGPL